MGKILSLFLLFLTILTVYSEQEENPFQIPSYLLVPNCKPEYPYLSGGDFHITDDNYTTIIRSTKLLLVFASSAYCYSCCKQEEFYYTLNHKYLKNSMINPLVFLFLFFNEILPSRPKKQKWLGFQLKKA